MQYLNAKQARLESEVEREFLSGSTGASSLSRQALTDASDLAPVQIGTPGLSPTDIDSMLMLISISHWVWQLHFFLLFPELSHLLSL